LMKIRKKFEVIANDKTIHYLMQISTLIPNMLVLLHKSLVKVIFLNKEKERKTSDAFVCN
jgi:hypothetical protein